MSAQRVSTHYCRTDAQNCCIGRWSLNFPGSQIHFSPPGWDKQISKSFCILWSSIGPVNCAELHSNSDSTRTRYNPSGNKPPLTKQQRSANKPVVGPKCAMIGIVHLACLHRPVGRCTKLQVILGVVSEFRPSLSRVCLCLRVREFSSFRVTQLSHDHGI